MADYTKMEGYITTLKGHNDKFIKLANDSASKNAQTISANTTTKASSKPNSNNKPGSRKKNDTSTTQMYNDYVKSLRTYRGK